MSRQHSFFSAIVYFIFFPPFQYLMVIFEKKSGVSVQFL